MKALINFYLKVIGWFAPIILSPFLLALRICFGLECFQAGWGKLQHIDRPIAYFTQLHIPFPAASAWLVGYTETIGGLLLLVGLLSRPVAFALLIDMSVAYITSERAALSKLFTAANADDFVSAAPFGIWLTAVLVLAVGPGLFSLDGIIKVIYRVICPLPRKPAMLAIPPLIPAPAAPPPVQR